MNIEIIERNYEAGEKLKEMTITKIEKLDKYFENGDTLRMEGAFWGGGVSKTGRTVHWDFDDPIDIDTVAGVSVGGWYIPLNRDGTAGAGHWLT